MVGVFLLHKIPKYKEIIYKAQVTNGHCQCWRYICQSNIKNVMKKKKV